MYKASLFSRKLTAKFVLCDINDPLVSQKLMAKYTRALFWGSQFSVKSWAPKLNFTPFLRRIYPTRISCGCFSVYTLTGTCFCTITLCIKLVPFRRLVRIPDEVILLDWKGSFSKGNYQSIVFRPLLFWNLVLINNINNVREPSLLACS